MTKYRNNHYAQRAIFKNWSALNPQGKHDGLVWHFDFVTRKFVHNHSRSVFAREGMWDEKAEQRFNKLVESPLAKFRDTQLRRVRREQETGGPVDNVTYRALSMLWLVNIARFNDAYARDKGTNDPKMVEELLAQSDHQLESAAGHFRNLFDLATVFVERMPLYYPEFGSFLLPIMDPEKRRPPAFALVYPLDPHFAFVAIRKGWTLRNQDSRMLHAYSVGSGQSRSVIVPALLMARPNAEEEVARVLLDLRRGVETIFAEVRALAAKLGHDTTGLSKGPSWPT